MREKPAIKLPVRNILIPIATAFWEQSRDVPNGTCLLLDFGCYKQNVPSGTLCYVIRNFMLKKLGNELADGMQVAQREQQDGDLKFYF